MQVNEIKQRDRPKAEKRIDRKTWFQRFWARWAADVLLVAGAAAITVGAALIYPPAGWIAGGALSIAGGVLAARSGGDS